MGVPWIKKHCPEKTSDVIAQSNNISILHNFASNYKIQKKKNLQK